MRDREIYEIHTSAGTFTAQTLTEAKALAQFEADLTGRVVSITRTVGR